METTERVVEAYVRYIKKWATIPNIKCPGQFEIDLLAIDPVTLNRYHIESGVSVSGAYSKLTAKPFDESLRRQRGRAAEQRRTIGYFIERKFNSPDVISTLEHYGFKVGRYDKIIVSWGWTDDAERIANEQKIVLWDFRSLMHEITATFKSERSYFTDDTMRTLHLYSHAESTQAD